ncbi:MAG: hypothetical protein M3Z09_05945 [Acidobacteriota bacterium]|nr:hypothetical protein [Acidobacteriota bacterium]
MNRDLDKLIDQALSTYSVGEPRAGLEERVLARVRQDRHRPFRFPLWAWVIPALGCMALVLTTWHNTPPRAVTIRGARPPEIHIADPVIPVSRPRRHSASKPKLARAPQLSTFPSPRSLTPEERSLLAFVNREPATALDFLNRESTPIQIEPLEIAPLENKE